jgi:hypothetical protein
MGCCRAKSVPERAENCSRERLPTDTANGLRSGHVQVEPRARPMQWIANVDTDHYRYAARGSCSSSGSATPLARSACTALSVTAVSVVTLVSILA